MFQTFHRSIGQHICKTMGVRVEKLELVQVRHHRRVLLLQTIVCEVALNLSSGAATILASQQGRQGVFLCSGTDQDCAEVLDRDMSGENR